MDWNFDQEKNAATLTTKQVMEEGCPILQVIHYSDDHSWAFMCGTTADLDDAMILSMQQVVSTDSTLHQISDLPPGWTATREEPGGNWYREKDSDA